jgi:hypothetical protein
MARADKLTNQVKSMSARIKELEVALADAQTHDSQHTHPLLLTPLKWQESDEVDLISEAEDDHPSSPPENIDDGAYISPHSQYLKEIRPVRPPFANLPIEKT